MTRARNRSHILLAVAALSLATASTANAAMVVKFFGTAQGGELTARTEQALAESGIDVEGFACFELPIFDVESGRPIGVGVDCLNVFDTAGDTAGDGLQLEAKTFFILPQGMIVNHGCTSVRPVFAGVGDAGITHMTASIPPGEFGADSVPRAECVEAGGMIHATGAFRQMAGAVRLSGAVDLSNAASGEITFSCLFVLDLGPGRSGFPRSFGRGRSNASD